MSFLQSFKMAMSSIRSNKVRSFLTMLGVIIGVAAVIAAVGFAKGSTKSITDSIASLGTNLISITITGRNSNRNVTYDEIKQFASENSSEISYVAPEVSSSGTIKVLSSTRDTTIMGTTPEYAEIKSQGVKSGRYISDFDVDLRQKVAVLGTAVVNDVFSGANPIGETIKVNGQVFTVVGVLEEKDGGQDSSADDTVIIPLTTAQRLLKNSNIRNFSIQAASSDTVNDVMSKATQMLTKIYSDSSSFRVFNQAQMLSTLNTVTSTLMIVLGGIAAISLIVGGVGIMNIMLVSVTERTREIGIRKAIGAKKKNILIQFLIEAVVVTGMGGIIGVAVGAGIIKFIIGGFNIVPQVYSVPWMIISFSISLLVGVIFGMFPAVKAANLNPIEALRYE